MPGAVSGSWPACRRSASPQPKDEFPSFLHADEAHSRSDYEAHSRSDSPLGEAPREVVHVKLKDNQGYEDEHSVLGAEGPRRGSSEARLSDACVQEREVLFHYLARSLFPP